jgi:hypothetical protein
MVLSSLASGEGTAATINAGISISELVHNPEHHRGHVLCIHRDILPVSRFHHDYTDSLGNHYHGFLPPAGPPFYVQCFDAMRAAGPTERDEPRAAGMPQPASEMAYSAFGALTSAATTGQSR